jgi:hypothetical protein
MAKSKDEIQLIPTPLPHVFMCDIDDSGLLKEILLVKKFDDGSISYVDLTPLHPIDLGRIKKVVTSTHADKYECWELLSQSRFSNGLNGLDFIHYNFVKTKRPRGARAVARSLADVQAYGDKLIGSEHVNPAESHLDTTTKVFNQA